MDPRVAELHCIMPIANVPSVLAHGILSHERASKLPHVSVALLPVQDKRDQKLVPQGMKLHRYANLYFHARNPMLSSLCVLRVTLAALSCPGSVITDCNAASDYVRFLHPSQWSLVDFDDVFALDWTHPGDSRRYFQHKSRKCAEVLVPHRVPPNLVAGAYVFDYTAKGLLDRHAPGLAVAVDPVLFFRSQSG